MVGTRVYACGKFTTAGGKDAKAVAVWDGATWNALGSGFILSYNGLSVIAKNGTGIYVGGYFTTTDGNTTDYFAVWNGTTC